MDFASCLVRIAGRIEGELLKVCSLKLKKRSFFLQNELRLNEEHASNLFRNSVVDIVSRLGLVRYPTGTRNSFFSWLHTGCRS